MTKRKLTFGGLFGLVMCSLVAYLTISFVVEVIL